MNDELLERGLPPNQLWGNFELGQASTAGRRRAHR